MSLTLHELNLAALAPEILLMLGICVFLVVEALTGRKECPRRADRMALLVLVAPLVVLLPKSRPSSPWFWPLPARRKSR